MNNADLFQFASGLASLGWALLLLVALLRAADWIRDPLLLLAGRVLPLLLAVLYGVALLTAWQGEVQGSFATLNGVKQLFASETVLLAGWIHYLAFDLFIGRWMLDDADDRGFCRWLLLPCLLLTFLLGPLGLLLYFLLRNRALARA